MNHKVSHHHSYHSSLKNRALLCLSYHPASSLFQLTICPSVCDDLVFELILVGNIVVFPTELLKPHSFYLNDLHCFQIISVPKSSAARLRDKWFVLRSLRNSHISMWYGY